MNRILKEVYEKKIEIRMEKEKKSKKKRQKEKSKNKEESKGEKINNFLNTLNLEVFELEKIKRLTKRLGTKVGKKETKEKKKLPRGVDGLTAKLIKIKLKIWLFRDKIKRVIKGKTE